MSHKNPYSATSNYGKLFAFMQKVRVFAKVDMIAQAVKIGISNVVKKGKNVSPAEATVTVMLSPRDEKLATLRGDCRGNMSARGEVYFNELLKRKTGEKQRYRLRWRPTALARRTRSKGEVKQEKVTKTAKKAKATKATKATKTAVVA